MLIAKLGALVRSPALRAAAMLMAGGFGFALANILLARVLPAEQFGLVSLVLALVQMGLTLGPLGIELAINRHSLHPHRNLRSWSLLTSVASGLLMAAFGAWLYDLSPALIVCLACAGTAASFNRVGCAFLQSQQRFGLSLLLGQIHNYVILLAVPAILLLDQPHAVTVAAMIAISYVLTSVIGWRAGANDPQGRTRAAVPVRSLLNESLAGFGILLATQLLWQLERLVIPRTLTMQDLATFAAVAAIAGSPFRMLQIGVGHTLLPGLRACTTQQAAKRLMLHEGAVLGAAAAAAVGVVVLLTPWIAVHFLMGRYDISAALLTAVILTGLVKVVSGFVTAVVQAFGSTKDLARLNALTWVAVAAAVGCAIFGARYGVTGVVYGVGVAWLAGAMAGGALARTAFRKCSLLGTAPRAAVPDSPRNDSQLARVDPRS